MEFKINQLPLKMKHISEKLFSSPFLSDIIFLIENKTIYAHSLELMKRSVVFQQQLQPTIGETKIIPIKEYDYNTYYQFIRFIYTDECDVRKTNRLELMILAKTYKLIRLINLLLNYNYNYIEKFDYTVVENHEIALRDTKLKLTSELYESLNSDAFLTIHPTTVKEILKFDLIKKDITEIDILEALVRWLRNFCSENEVKFSVACQSFKNLIHLIRFPTMSAEELRTVKTKYPDLLPESDFLKIAAQKIYGTNEEVGIWNCTPRTEFIWPYEWKTSPNLGLTKIKFTVSSEKILAGFVFGSNSDVIKQILITISCQNSELDQINEIYFDETDVLGSSIVISLGDSILIQPGFTYSINYIFVNQVDLLNEERKYWSRTQHTELVINAPPNSVEVLEAHETMHEILFLNPQINIT